jgi:DNA-directed RNA polymerase subunit beta'
MLKTTAGQLLINEALPEDLRDYARKLDKKGVKALFQKVQEKYPDKYREIAKSLSDVGHRVATESGGYSFGLSALRITPKAKALREQLA